MEPKHTLLLVDDEENILHALRRVFRRMDCRILTAPSGPAGLELVRANAVSLVISDQRMPEMIGAEFLGHVREISPRTIRIMLTGYSDIEAATQAINEGGVYRYITKPWDDEQLKITVREALERFDLEEINRTLTAELQEKNAALEQLNENLEQKVEERTGELRAAYEENLALTRALQLKVRELEGRDRIAQHLLTFNSLEETLDLVLEVIGDTLELDRAVIYLTEGGELKPAAAFGITGPAATRAPGDLARLEITPFHQHMFAAVQQSLEPMNLLDTREYGVSPFALVPVLREADLLGLIEVGRKPEAGPVSEEQLQTLSSFALQAAVAISDAQTRHHIDTWQDGLEEMVPDVDDLDRLIS